MGGAGLYVWMNREEHSIRLYVPLRWRTLACKTPNSLRNSQVSQSLQYRLIWNLKPRFSVVSGTFEARLFILTDFILINLTSSSVNSQTDCMFHFAGLIQILDYSRYYILCFLGQSLEKVLCPQFSSMRRYEELLCIFNPKQ